MSRGRRILLAAACAAGTAAVLWLLRPLIAPDNGDTVALVDPRQELIELFAARDAAHLVAAPAPLPRLPLDRRQAALFCPRSRGVRFDEYTLSRRKPNLAVNRPFPEHPDGKWVVRTNRYGMREDENPAAEPPDLRVVVAGDSHVDGVCPNAESFPNQLERLLGERRPEETIEVLNVATGGWSFYNYVGALERFLFLEPDVYVFTVYGGNDFGALALHHYHRGEPLLFTDTEEREALAEIARGNAGRAQYWDQAAYFQSHPEEERAALEMAVDTTAEMLRIAREHGIRLIAVYLPPLPDVQADRYRQLIAPWMAGLELDEEALGAPSRLADAWLAWCADHGVTTLDLRPAFTTADEPLYWRTDQHLDTAGHRVVAEALLPLLESSSD